MLNQNLKHLLCKDSAKKMKTEAIYLEKYLQTTCPIKVLYL